MLFSSCPYNTSVPQAVRDKIVHSLLVHNILCLLNICQKETVSFTSFYLKYYDTLIQNKILWALISSSSAHLKYLRGQMFKTLIGISFQHLSITVGPVVNIFSQFWKVMALSNSQHITLIWLLEIHDLLWVHYKKL